MNQPGKKARVLIVVWDDTTVMMAISFVKECERLGLDYSVALIQCREKVQRLSEDGIISESREYAPQLSVRQIAMIKERTKSFVRINDESLGRVAALFDVVLLTKIPLHARESLQRDRAFLKNRRCVLVGFSSGLDATPRLTILNRAFTDILMANSPSHQRALRKFIGIHWKDHPIIGLGHPFFARRAPFRHRKWDDVKSVYFLHQSVLPSNPVTRGEVFSFLVDLAQAHPSKRFVIKLRHRTDENKRNVNKEQYSPQEFFAGVSSAQPNNLVFDDCTFTETLDKAHLFISVSSSGILEGLVNGVPSLFVDGFRGEEQDGIFYKMLDQFRPAGLVVHKDRLLTGILPDSDPSKLADQFCEVDYFENLLSLCETVRADPSSAMNRGAVNRLPVDVRFRRTGSKLLRLATKKLL